MKLSDEIDIVTEMIDEAKTEVTSDRSSAAENGIPDKVWPIAARYGVEKTLAHVLKLLEGIKADALKVEERMRRRCLPDEDIEDDKPTGREYDSHGNLKLRPEL